MNTRSKRASSVGLGLFWLLAPPLPDGTLDQGDRQHIAISYSGIAAASPVPSVFSTVHLYGVYAPDVTLHGIYAPEVTLGAKV